MRLLINDIEQLHSEKSQVQEEKDNLQLDFNDQSSGKESDGLKEECSLFVKDKIYVLIQVGRLEAENKRLENKLAC